MEFPFVDKSGQINLEDFEHGPKEKHVQSKLLLDAELYTDPNRFDDDKGQRIWLKLQGGCLKGLYELAHYCARMSGKHMPTPCMTSFLERPVRMHDCLKEIIEFYSDPTCAISKEQAFALIRLHTLGAGFHSWFDGMRKGTFKTAVERLGHTTPPKSANFLHDKVVQVQKSNGFRYHAYEKPPLLEALLREIHEAQEILLANGGQVLTFCAVEGDEVSTTRTRGISAMVHAACWTITSAAASKLIDWKWVTALKEGKHFYENALAKTVVEGTPVYDMDLQATQIFFRLKRNEGCDFPEKFFDFVHADKHLPHVHVNLGDKSKDAFMKMFRNVRQGTDLTEPAAKRMRESESAPLKD